MFPLTLCLVQLTEVYKPGFVVPKNDETVEEMVNLDEVLVL
jgi:hypothetical protein